jgi:hypothetical protein
LAYSLNFYVDNRHFTQRTATIAFRYKTIGIQTENDAFAFTPKDEFRTGHVHIYYQDSLLQLGTELKLWTDLKARHHAPSSHGILNVFANYTLPLTQQFVFVQIGLDNENIRDVFQNKLIHQSKLLKWLNPHVKQGDVLKLRNDSKSKTKFYFQTGLNSTGY